MRMVTLLPLALGGLLASAGLVVPAIAAAPIRLDVARAFPVRETSVSTATSDLDGDGRLDLVITGYAGDSLLVVFDPLAAAPARRTTSVPGPPVDIAAGDVDRDGRVDLVCSLADDRVVVLHNAGGATFTVAATLPGGARPCGVVLADLDRDGDLDLAVACHDENAVRVYPNLGGGVFGEGTSYPVGTGPVLLLAADATDDGALDLVTGEVEGRSVSCLPNLGNGTFGASAVSPVGDWVRDLAAGDLDGDGHLDLAVSKPMEGVLLWGDGSGRFVVDAGFSAPPGRSAYNMRAGVAILNLDGDGRLDLLFPERGTCPSYCENIPDVLRAWRNLGGRVFERGLGFRTNRYNRSLKVADLDVDGRMDIVATATSTFEWPRQASVSVLRARGDGILGGVQEYAFWTEPDPAFTLPRAKGVQAVTLRPDGLADLVIQVETRDAHGLQLCRNHDGVGFDPPVELDPGRMVVVSDLDGDGRTDLLIGRGDTLVTRRGLSTSEFAAPATVATGVTFLTLGDFDGDHRPDMAYRDTAQSIFVAYGNGDGTFGPPVATGLGAFVPSIMVLAAGAGDLHAEGRDDLILAGVGQSYPEDTAVVCQPLHGGAFDVVTTVGLPRTIGYHPAEPIGVQATDLDGDGRADVIVRVSSCNAFHVLTSGADGSLVLRQTVYQSCEYAYDTHLAIADLSDDGIPDLIASIPLLDYTGGFQFHTGRGDGTFDVVEDYTYGDAINSVTVGRFDRDSRLDVAYTSYRGNWLAVAFNLPAHDDTTSALAVLVSAAVTDGHARLMWDLSGATVVAATVQRTDDAVAWADRARLAPEGDGRVRFEDADVAPGARYGYRLAVTTVDRTLTTATTWIDVPSPLALAGARPNPVTGDLTVAFSLDRRTVGTLTLFDIAGRRIATSDFDALAPGEHRVRLAAAGALRPGLYLIRLATAGRTLTARAVVVR